MKERERWADAVRGFTIYLMVLGHCIQYATPDGYEFNENIVFQMIYGFHMPLFMMVSGYLFWYSLEKYDLAHGIWTKIKGIMVPCATWGFVTYLCDILVMGYEDISVMGYLEYVVFSNWFLWAVFYCSLYGFVAKYLFRNHIAGYAVVIIINCLMPVAGNYAGTKRMLPFFIIGMIVSRYRILDRLQNINVAVIGILLVVAYIVTVKTGCAELVTGITGGAFAVIMFRWLCGRFKLKVLCMLGEVSISIYLSTGIVFYFWVKEYFRISDSYRYLIKSAYVLGMSVLLTAAAFLLSKLMQKNKALSRLFLGR